MAYPKLAAAAKLIDEIVGGWPDNLLYKGAMDDIEQLPLKLRESAERGLAALPAGVFEDFVRGDYEECETFAETMRLNWSHVPVTKDLISADKLLNEIYGSQEKEGYYAGIQQPGRRT